MLCCYVMLCVLISHFKERLKDIWLYGIFIDSLINLKSKVQIINLKGMEIVKNFPNVNEYNTQQSRF